MQKYENPFVIYTVSWECKYAGIFFFLFFPGGGGVVIYWIED